jgi:hypothetical protein
MTADDKWSRLDGMGWKERLKTILDDKKAYASILSNNVDFLFPIAERAAIDLKAIAEDIREGSRLCPALVRDVQEFEKDADEWSVLARRCCLEVLNIEPDPNKRVTWGIEVLVGYKDSVDKKSGKWIRTGGTWVGPSSRSLTQQDAMSRMQMLFSVQMKRDEQVGLPAAFRIVSVPPKAADKTT